MRNNKNSEHNATIGIAFVKILFYYETDNSNKQKEIILYYCQ